MSSLPVEAEYAQVISVARNVEVKHNWHSSTQDWDLGFNLGPRTEDQDQDQDVRTHRNEVG